MTCEGGCACAPSVLEGHWEQKNSQLSMHRISVSQSPKCTLKIRVLGTTSSGEHKVKVQVTPPPRPPPALGPTLALLTAETPPLARKRKAGIRARHLSVRDPCTSDCQISEPLSAVQGHRQPYRASC